ncbi:MAG: hypothetical protein Q9218_005098 [Villophora microphyllina]
MLFEMRQILLLLPIYTLHTQCASSASIFRAKATRDIDTVKSGDNILSATGSSDIQPIFPTKHDNGTSANNDQGRIDPFLPHILPEAEGPTAFDPSSTLRLGKGQVQRRKIREAFRHLPKGTPSPKLEGQKALPKASGPTAPGKGDGGFAPLHHPVDD